jgi:hypothetical protein
MYWLGPEENLQLLNLNTNCLQAATSIRRASVWLRKKARGILSRPEGEAALGPRLGLS